MNYQIKLDLIPCICVLKKCSWPAALLLARDCLYGTVGRLLLGRAKADDRQRETAATEKRRLFTISRGGNFFYRQQNCVCGTRILMFESELLEALGYSFIYSS